MKKLRMRLEELAVESFETISAPGVSRGTVQARGCSASEEGESLCCPTETDEASCYGTCQGTCQGSCGCSGWDCSGVWTCHNSCICPSHHATECPELGETCGNSCWC